MKYVVRIVLLGAFGLLLTAGAWAQSSEEQQSLGDVARQEKAKKPKKTITDEDLPQGTASSGSESASSAAEKSSEEKSDAAAKEGEEKTVAEGDEEKLTPAQEADEAKKKLDALKHDEESLKRGMSRLEEKLANETKDSMRETYATALQHAQANLADTQKKRVEAEKEAAAKDAAAKEAQQSQPQEQPPQ